jgi:3-hydroxybutyryl-CoA dehydratase
MPEDGAMSKNMVFDSALYQQEIFFNDLEKGQTFPPYRYRLEHEYVQAYLQAVGEANPVFRDERAAREAGFEGAIVPPPAVLSYGYIYSAMRRRPPTGYLNTSVRFEFLSPLQVGAELTLNLSVEDKFTKRERKYIILKAMVEGAEGKVVACAHIDCIFPA